ncbi:glycosyltransferase [Bizionia paragorgiae]|uniref:glycosyltransferase n=1 Tax=Bizionia paragorgiae TaxID=283786 RepID=UPI00299ED210|nr:glycosyltransferase [Bizionia paragorgiae]MDX1271204.1 glycosyltransferase [Bizionia paragorgiae]
MFFKKESLVFKEKNVLIVDEIIPEFNKDSGSRRLKEIISILLKNDIGVFLLADYRQHRYKSDYFEVYKKMGVNVYQPAIFKDEVLTIEGFIKLIAPKLNYAWLHRPHIFDKYQSIVNNANPKVKLIYDMVDFHYVRLQREYELNKNEDHKIDAQNYLELETKNSKEADVTIAISETDKALLLKHYNKPQQIKVLSNIHQHLPKTANFKTFEDRKNLLFIGNFRHTPNQDAILFLHDKIMPIIWKTLPDVKVDIIGSYATEDIKALHSEQFNVIGFVDDVKEYFYSSRLFIAPLRYGAGIKGKIGQSLEYSLPLITTDIGAEGFNFGVNHDAMVGNTPQDIAAKIIEVYTNKEVWDTLSDYSEQILEPFSLKSTEDTVLNLIK